MVADIRGVRGRLNPEPASGALPERITMQTSSSEQPRDLAAWLYFGAAGALALSTFVPWFSVHADSDLAGGGPPGGPDLAAQLAGDFRPDTLLRLLPIRAEYPTLGVHRSGHRKPD